MLRQDNPTGRHRLHHWSTIHHQHCRGALRTLTNWWDCADWAYRRHSGRVRWPLCVFCCCCRVRVARPTAEGYPAQWRVVDEGDVGSEHAPPGSTQVLQHRDHHAVAHHAEHWWPSTPKRSKCSCSHPDAVDTHGVHPSKWTASDATRRPCRGRKWSCWQHTQ